MCYPYHYVVTYPRLEGGTAGQTSNGRCIPRLEILGTSRRETGRLCVGVEDSVIKIRSNWQSSAFTQYVRVPRDKLAEVSSPLAS